MPNSSTDRVICRKYLENAQGYLELATLFEDRWALPVSQKHRLADHAIDCLVQAEPLQGEPSTWLLLRGMAHHLQQQPDQAIQRLQEAVQLAPQRVELHLNLAWFHRIHGRWTAAIETLLHGLSHLPDHPLLHYNLGCYFCLTRQWERSLNHLNQCLQKDPTLRSQLEQDPDLEQLRQHSGWSELLSCSSN